MKNKITSVSCQVVQDDEGEETIFPSEDEPLGRNITDDLCNFLFQEKHKNHYVIAHNLRVRIKKVLFCLKIFYYIHSHY